MLDEIYGRLLGQVLSAQSDPRYASAIERWKQIASSHEIPTAADWGRVLAEIYRVDPESRFGLDYGRLLRPALLCDFSRLLMVSHTIEEAFDLASNLYFINDASWYPLLYRDAERFSVGVGLPYKNQVNASHQRFCSETLFSFTLNAIEDAIGERPAPTRVWFAYPSPADLSSFQRMFGSNITFGAPMSLIEFDAAILKRIGRYHHPELQKIYRNRCLEIWKSSQREQRDHTFRQQTIALMMRFHPACFKGDALAARLNLSVSGLQKRMARSGTSLTAMSSLVRRELSKFYLCQRGTDLTTASEALGFQSLSGFRRHFTAEFGFNPALLINFAREEGRPDKVSALETLVSGVA